MKFRVLIYLLGSSILFSCQNDDYQEVSALDVELEEVLMNASNGVGNQFFELPESEDLDAIPQDPMNPLTMEKVLLGKMLLHEPAMGRNPKDPSMAGTYSCASCHHAAAGFAAGVRQGIGEGGVGFGFTGEGRLPHAIMHRDSLDIQPIKSPTILNVAYQDVMLWNGQFGGGPTNAGTEAQWGPFPENSEGWLGIEVQAMVGQNVHRQMVDRDFVEENGYLELFNRAFADVPESQRYSRKNAALAMAAFERTVLANKSPWQNYLKGNKNALTDEEKEGAILFMTKGKCAECHTGPALSSNTFYGFGMGDFDDSQQAIIQSSVNMDAVRKGRGGFTKNPADDYTFKTPTLYNLGHGNLLGHGGTFSSVEEIIRYKMAGIKQNQLVPDSQLADQFGNIDLSDEEVDLLTAFVENALQDRDLERYLPSSLPSNSCFPNADSQSMTDMNCQ